MGTDFEHDVAFSFLAGDEGIALRIAGILGDRFRTFVYSEHQKDLAGKDGEEKFAEVFGKQSRVVVILYRPEWGGTKWTRIEQTAIRNRAHEEGYDFTLWVPLQAVEGMPLWLPKSRLYFNLERFGDAGLVAVIEQLIQQQGGNAKPETLAERGERMQREVTLGQARKDLIDGHDLASAQLTSASAKDISDALVAWAESDQALRPEVRRHGNCNVLLTVNRGGHAPLCLTTRWSQPYTNHVGPKARYEAQLYEGAPEWPGLWVVDVPTKRKALRFRPDLNSAFERCWKRDGEDGELSAIAAAELIARLMMEDMVTLSSPRR